MNSESLNKIIGNKELQLVDALKRIDENSMGTLFITDVDKRLIGCISDGDVRRWIVKTGNLNVTVGEMMNTKVYFLHVSERDKANRLMREAQIRILPILDAEGHVIDAVAIDKSKEKLNKTGNIGSTPVIIMAGGKGTRLAPYTKILPKPLIPIGDVPILERILNRFYSFGVGEFFISVNYRKDMIKSYFNESPHPYKIYYIDEERPLGTAGSLRLIDNHQFNGPIYITNCDTIIETDYMDALQFHKSMSNDMTIISSLKHTSIPYGVLHTAENGEIKAMEEKPSISYLINTGMYIMQPEFIAWIPQNTEYNMTDLVVEMINKGKKVCNYPISEDSFLDMGELEELKRMQRKIEGRGELE